LSKFLWHADAKKFQKIDPKIKISKIFLDGEKIGKV